jgi:hypothetical protein
MACACHYVAKNEVKFLKCRKKSTSALDFSPLQREYSHNNQLQIIAQEYQRKQRTPGPLSRPPYTPLNPICMGGLLLIVLTLSHATGVFIKNK